MAIIIWLSLWDEKLKHPPQLPQAIELENWTAFSSSSGIAGKPIESWDFAYTRLGQVDMMAVEPVDEAVDGLRADVSRLVLGSGRV